MEILDTQKQIKIANRILRKKLNVCLAFTGKFSHEFKISFSGTTESLHAKPYSYTEHVTIMC